MKRFLYLIFLLPCFAKAQHSSDVFGIQVGYGSFNITAKDAYRQQINLFGFKRKTGNTFVGDGINLGLTKEIDSNLFLAINYSSFSGKDTDLEFGSYLGNYILSHSISGYQIPISINYLLRKNSRKLRINLGAGLQYIQANITQTETITENNLTQTNVVKQLDISQLQFMLRPGLQYRILPNLFAVYAVNIAIPFTGNYNDGPNFSIKYIFRNN